MAASAAVLAPMRQYELACAPIWILTEPPSLVNYRDGFGWNRVDDFFAIWRKSGFCMLRQLRCTARVARRRSNASSNCCEALPRPPGAGRACTHAARPASG